MVPFLLSLVVCMTSFSSSLMAWLIVVEHNRYHESIIHCNLQQLPCRYW